MTKYYDATVPYIQADTDKVLCNGYSMTGLGGKVSSKDTAILDAYQEMTYEEAEALVAYNDETEISDEEFTDMVEEVL